MPKLALVLAAATAAILGSGAAQAQTAAAPRGPAASPDVTVRAPERMVCRPVTRTSTRLRVARVCRPVSQLNAADQRNQDEELAQAADTLEMYGEKVSTNCIGGLGGREHDTPLGPR